MIPEGQQTLAWLLMGAGLGLATVTYRVKRQSAPPKLVAGRYAWVKVLMVGLLGGAIYKGAEVHAPRRMNQVKQSVRLIVLDLASSASGGRPQGGSPEAGKPPPALAEPESVVPAGRGQPPRPRPSSKGIPMSEEIRPPMFTPFEPEEEPWVPQSNIPLAILSSIVGMLVFYTLGKAFLGGSISRQKTLD